METIFSQWKFNLGASLLFILLITFYFYLTKGKLKMGAAFYFFGCFLMLVLSLSPLHFIGMHYLLSAYMVMHILLLLICGPFILMGIPKETPNTSIKKTSVFFFNYPWMGWLAGIGLMWFWHIPKIFDAAFPKSQSLFGFYPLAFLHMLTLLLAGIFFAWPILGPHKELRAHPLVGLVYLASACVGCSILGLFLTFAPPTLYHHYFMADTFGFASTIKHNWGIDRAMDQQMAGLMMWVPCCFIYLSGCMMLFFKYINAKEKPIVIENNKLERRYS
ncbi:cytochrome c oxidase assembly protein [Pedobacter sp. SD-b]|uniref:Cytochrome c oxidase assembly protein n=1 Tax=Pedobacter segetis TaxID=2793069 RepID=A0ABS1BFA0_9SPHI|nr:cytochrome c oxidase assembly protein [Pedobacter segetis]MBK0381540.1 cytochrome c oxidase assembly protein [Pedobacter segetis]